MKPPRVHPLLLVALPCAGFLAGWWLLRGGEPAPAGSAAAPSATEARVAERRPLAPEPLAAAPASEAAVAPRDPWIELNNAATLDLTEGDLAAAVDKFERCLAAEPSSPVFAGNLAETLVRLARLEHERRELEPAIAHLARALELGAERADAEALARLLERWRRELELEGDDWTEGSSRFELSYDTDRSDILHHSHEVLEHLEESYDGLVRWLGVDPLEGAPAIRVVLYDPEDFDRLTGLGDWAAGLFDGVVRVSVRDLLAGQQWRAVLVHELVHAFVRALGGNEVPGWLNEGLAQLLDGTASDVARLRERLRASEPFPLERLAGSLAAWDDKAEIARAYAQSLAFVAYLRDTYGDESLRRMLRAREHGRTLAEEFERFASVPLPVAFDDWREGLRR